MIANTRPSDVSVIAVASLAEAVSANGIPSRHAIRPANQRFSFLNGMINSLTYIALLLIQATSAYPYGVWQFLFNVQSQGREGSSVAIRAKTPCHISHTEGSDRGLDIYDGIVHNVNDMSRYDDLVSSEDRRCQGCRATETPCCCKYLYLRECESGGSD